MTERKTITRRDALKAGGALAGLPVDRRVVDRGGRDVQVAVRQGQDLAVLEIGRASCRKECQSVCRSRWSPYH